VYFEVPFKILKDFKDNFDVVIDEINAIPWLTPLYLKSPKIAFIHQTTKRALFEELNKAIAFLIYLLERLGLLFYRRLPIITVSGSTREELISNGMPRRNVFVVHPGIDAERYKRVREEKSVAPMILYLGRLKKYKGVQYLVQAMEHILAQVPRARLLIVGKGDYQSTLAKIVKDLNLQDYVSFEGYVSEKKKARLLKKAWVLVVPSVMEGFGIVVIEAATCGTPAIGTNVMGLRDSILDGRTGFLVPYGEPETLAQKITEVLDEDMLRSRLSENASEWGETFSWEGALRKFEMIIQESASKSS
jgi:glycosyltransferase involved in cell wall biosynthesis